jgi:hypothetical protein
MSTVEENQMCLRGTVCCFVDAKEPLDRRSRPALLLGVELLDAKLSR